MGVGNTNRDAAAFWGWFSQEADAIASLLSASKSLQLESLLSHRVASLGAGLGWEVGPGLDAEYGLALSPNGDRERLRLTDSIVAAAPDLKGWEFHSGKPPKRWDMRFYVGDHFIDARPWRYLLTGYNDGEFYDVTLVAPNLPASLDDRRELTGYLLVEGVLGERAVIESIGRIEVEIGVPDDSEGRLSDVAVLAKHFRHLRDSR